MNVKVQLKRKLDAVRDEDRQEESVIILENRNLKRNVV